MSPTLNPEIAMHKTRALPCFALALAGLTTMAVAQDLPARWDELTAGDWPKAIGIHDGSVLDAALLGMDVGDVGAEVREDFLASAGLGGDDGDDMDHS